MVSLGKSKLGTVLRSKGIETKTPEERIKTISGGGYAGSDPARIAEQAAREAAARQAAEEAARQQAEAEARARELELLKQQQAQQKQAEVKAVILKERIKLEAKQRGEGFSRLETERRFKREGLTTQQFKGGLRGARQQRQAGGVDVRAELKKERDVILSQQKQEGGVLEKRQVDTFKGIPVTEIFFTGEAGTKRLATTSESIFFRKREREIGFEQAILKAPSKPIRTAKIQLQNIAGPVLSFRSGVATELKEITTDPIAKSITKGIRKAETIFGVDLPSTIAEAEIKSQETTKFAISKGVPKATATDFERISGFGLGQLKDVRQKPLKQVELFGAGALIGAAVPIISRTATAISPAFGRFITRGLTTAGLTLGGTFAINVGSQVIAAPTPLEQGEIVGVAAKDIFLLSAGVKSGARLSKRIPIEKGVKAIKDLRVEGLKKTVRPSDLDPDFFKKNFPTDAQVRESLRRVQPLDRPATIKKTKLLKFTDKQVRQSLKRLQKDYIFDKPFKTGKPEIAKVSDKELLKSLKRLQKDYIFDRPIKIKKTELPKFTDKQVRQSLKRLQIDSLNREIKTFLTEPKSKTSTVTDAQVLESLKRFKIDSLNREIKTFLTEPKSKTSTVTDVELLKSLQRLQKDPKLLKIFELDNLNKIQTAQIETQSEALVKALETKNVKFDPITREFVKGQLKIKLKDPFLSSTKPLVTNINLETLTPPKAKPPKAPPKPSGTGRQQLIQLTKQQPVFEIKAQATQLSELQKLSLKQLQKTQPQLKIETPKTKFVFGVPQQQQQQKLKVKTQQKIQTVQRPKQDFGQIQFQKQAFASGFATPRVRSAQRKSERRASTLAFGRASNIDSASSLAFGTSPSLKFASAQLFAQSQARTQRFRQPSRLRLLTEQVQKEKDPIGGFDLFDSKGRKKKGGRFTTLVRRRGKFRPIGVSKSAKKAFELGRQKVSDTLAASFKIKGLGSLPQLPKGFRRSKRETGVVVEKRGKRLSKKTETKAIQKAKKKRKLTKSKRRKK